MSSKTYIILHLNISIDEGHTIFYNQSYHRYRVFSTEMRSSPALPALFAILFATLITTSINRVCSLQRLKLLTKIKFDNASTPVVFLLFCQKNVGLFYIQPRKNVVFPFIQPPDPLHRLPRKPVPPPWYGQAAAETGNLFCSDVVNCP